MKFSIKMNLYSDQIKSLIDSFKNSKQVTFVDLGFETSIYPGEVSDSRLEFLENFPE